MLSDSGHGGQVPDKNDDEPDAQDETWCLYDGELLDDETYSLLSELSEGVRILVFSDSCHSGTSIKDEHIIPQSLTYGIHMLILREPGTVAAQLTYLLEPIV